jgi:hypothetical protein
VSTTEGLSHNSTAINIILSAKETKPQINTRRFLNEFIILLVNEKIKVELEGSTTLYWSGEYSTLRSHTLQSKFTLDRYKGKAIPL